MESGSNVKVDRFLKCTRGLVISTQDDDPEGLQRLKSYLDPKWKLLPYGEAHHPAKDLQDVMTMNTMMNDSDSTVASSWSRMLNTNEVCSLSACPSDHIEDLTVADINEIKDAIKANIESGIDGDASFAGSKTDSVGELLRLVFHDVSAFVKGSGSLSGLNGCVDMTFPSNAGLAPSINFLLNVKATLNKPISDSDMFVLGAIAAIEAGGGPTNIPFRYGRRDIPCECEDDFFPNPESPEALVGTGELDNTMVARNGFTRREVTALVSIP